MAAALAIGTTRSAGAIGSNDGHATQAGINFAGLRHRRIPVTGASNNDTISSDLPSGMVAVAWETETADEECNATLASGTVTFNTDGATSYSGYLHIWSAS